ncbi:P2R1A-PPP2R2A-interacting phosphatase regulator 1 [Anthonomus grandis grandis]|uniref:P2R1A-PPP2R2A-interacting phosphatase regulator 1 n=1 Tax=Anthonomus grandis grandis TaxID=2921223 RepID=UPI0021659D30|nr:P2R1A-PPP2R2A-interacting phosphatase regulator 1 [Anthonomus grandis grandis]
MSSSNSAMDVDGAPGNAPGPLKRCSSAPMINEVTSSTMTATSSSSSTPSNPTSFANIFGFANSTRNRRHSTSFSQVPGSPVSGLRRIHQLRQEEQEVTSNSRELAHEKEIHSAMQISHSCEDLTLMPDSSSGGEHKGNRMGPIHVNLPPNSFMCNSPSPTRGYGFQSPTRCKTSFIRRSESPVLRPSTFGGAKRKLDERDVDFSVSPRPKRVYSYSSSDSRGLLTTTSNSLPGSLSSVGTPESLSSADSPGFAFRTVDSPSPTLQGVGVGEGKGGDHDMAESPS